MNNCALVEKVAAATTLDTRIAVDAMCDAVITSNSVKLQTAKSARSTKKR